MHAHAGFCSLISLVACRNLPGGNICEHDADRQTALEPVSSQGMPGPIRAKSTQMQAQRTNTESAGQTGRQARDSGEQAEGLSDADHKGLHARQHSESGTTISPTSLSCHFSSPTGATRTTLKTEQNYQLIGRVSIVIIRKCTR